MKPKHKNKMVSTCWINAPAAMLEKRVMQDAVCTVARCVNKERYSKLSISLSQEMAGWLRRRSSKAGTSISWIIRDNLRPEFDKRHAK
jgi:hypothetical protein